MRGLTCLTIVLLALGINSCKKAETPGEPKLIFKFKFDPTQQRLNNIGEDAAVPAGHAGQSPDFKKMSAHYIELAPGALTPLGEGNIVYMADETNAGGGKAIDFEKSSFAGNNETFFSMPLKSVAKGEYEYLRVSLAYQSYDIKFYLDTTVSGITIKQEFPCTVASFVGYNTYIKNYKIKNETINVNGNRAQGYWGVEASGTYIAYPYSFVTTGQAPGTTVVNPLFASSPIPSGSCVVTGAFDGGKLNITGNETKDIVITVSLSTNKSFEWEEVVEDGKWEPSKGENIVDMGLRGLIPYVEY